MWSSKTTLNKSGLYLDAEKFEHHPFVYTLTVWNFNSISLKKIRFEYVHTRYLCLKDLTSSCTSILWHVKLILCHILQADV